MLIPPLIEQCTFKHVVQAKAKDHALILVSDSENHRAGWSEAFKEMAQGRR